MKLKQYLQKLKKNKNSDFIEYEYFEEMLLESDLGPKLTIEIIEEIRQKKLRDVNEIKLFLRKFLMDILVNAKISFDTKTLSVVLFMGVNGVGKTTSLAKIANCFKDQYSMVIAAADTFRAAAVDQLLYFGNQLNIPVIYKQHKFDAAAVVYEAIESAINKKVNLLLIDTAGRMYNEINLINQLKKLSRVATDKFNLNVHNLLVLDSMTGQNIIEQAKVFDDSLGVHSIMLTKFDSTSKGGAIFPLSRQLSIPFSFLGTGEGVNNIEVFDGEKLVDYILGD